MILLLLLVALVVTTSQILMKLAANMWSSAGTFLEFRVLAMFSVAMLIGLVGQLLWFYLLKIAPISTSYPFLALVFVLVPIGGYLFFGERIAAVHYLSMALIISGVAVLGFQSRL